ncbi:MAG TPA: hypothetical protein VNT26_14465, partial [Candidatus Sulfotelmatobacter sp.]|nr:hypothetical protein [Candidatus Sulfotelmatobacter sp.]
LHLSDPQHRALSLYTAIFLVAFLSEQGMQFNRSQPTPVNWPFVHHARHLIDRLLHEACH